MYSTFANRSTKEVSGAKLHLAKEMTTDGKVIIIKMYCWVCNICRCNMYDNNNAKGKKKD